MDNELRYCEKCLQPNTRPGLTFNQDGVCFPCEVAGITRKVDWAARRRELDAIIEWSRSRGRGEYDCVVGVSGGKDSLRQALIVRDELRLRPLCVSCVSPPEMQTEIGADNLENLILNGFDVLGVAPAPGKWKQMMLRSFSESGNYCRVTERALYATPLRMAIAMDIPLIFFGENNALVYGEDTDTHGGEASNLWAYNTLAGGLSHEFMGEGMKDSDLICYNMPRREQLQEAQIRIAYLGYFFEDFNNYRNAEIAIEHGLKIRTCEQEEIGAINLFDALDDDFVPINQMLKHLKFGFGKANDEVCELIRLGRMSRSEGIEVLRNIDGKVAHRYIAAFSKYLGISEDKFWDVAERYRNRDLWERGDDNQWRLKRPVWNESNA